MTAHCKPDPTEYAPYHHYAKFWHAVADYDVGRSEWTETTGEQRQAYDCGIQYAMRLARWVEGRNAA